MSGFVLRYLAYKATGLVSIKPFTKPQIEAAAQYLANFSVAGRTSAETFDFNKKALWETLLEEAAGFRPGTLKLPDWHEFTAIRHQGDWDGSYGPSMSVSFGHRNNMAIGDCGGVAVGLTDGELADLIWCKIFQDAAVQTLPYITADTLPKDQIERGIVRKVILGKAVKSDHFLADLFQTPVLMKFLKVEGQLDEDTITKGYLTEKWDAKDYLPDFTSDKSHTSDKSTVLVRQSAQHPSFYIRVEESPLIDVFRVREPVLYAGLNRAQPGEFFIIEDGRLSWRSPERMTFIPQSQYQPMSFNPDEFRPVI